MSQNLLFQISENVEHNFDTKVSRKYDEKLELIRCLTPGLQIKAIDKMFSSQPISTNSFFKDMEAVAIRNFLESFDIVNVMAGETIYAAGQPSTHSRFGLLTSIVYLILKGRINCIFKTKICFKSYVKGSYFGDIEIFKKAPRVFTTRAQYNSCLLAIDAQKLLSTLKKYPNYHRNLLQRSIKRYLSIFVSMKQIKLYEGMVPNDGFWTTDRKSSGMLRESHYMNEISLWLENINQKHLNESEIMQSFDHSGFANLNDSGMRRRFSLKRKDQKAILQDEKLEGNNFFTIQEAEEKEEDALSEYPDKPILSRGVSYLKSNIDLGEQRQGQRRHTAVKSKSVLESIEGSFKGLGSKEVLQYDIDQLAEIETLLKQYESISRDLDKKVSKAGECIQKLKGTVERYESKIKLLISNQTKLKKNQVLAELQALLNESQSKHYSDNIFDENSFSNSMELNGEKRLASRNEERSVSRQNLMAHMPSSSAGSLMIEQLEPAHPLAPTIASKKPTPNEIPSPRANIQPSLVELVNNSDAGMPSGNLDSETHFGPIEVKKRGRKSAQEKTVIRILGSPKLGANPPLFDTAQIKGSHSSRRISKNLSLAALAGNIGLFQPIPEVVEEVISPIVRPSAHEADHQNSPDSKTAWFNLLTSENKSEIWKSIEIKTQKQLPPPDGNIQTKKASLHLSKVGNEINSSSSRLLLQDQHEPAGSQPTHKIKLLPIIDYQNADGDTIQFPSARVVSVKSPQQQPREPTLKKLTPKQIFNSFKMRTSDTGQNNQDPISVIKMKSPQSPAHPHLERQWSPKGSESKASSSKGTFSSYKEKLQAVYDDRIGLPTDL